MEATWEEKKCKATVKYIDIFYFIGKKTKI